MTLQSSALENTCNSITKLYDKYILTRYRTEMILFINSVKQCNENHINTKGYQNQQSARYQLRSSTLHIMQNIYTMLLLPVMLTKSFSLPKALPFLSQPSSCLKWWTNKFEVKQKSIISESQKATQHQWYFSYKNHFSFS